MATLLFADHSALAAALSSGAVPPEVAGAPARAGIDSLQRVWLQTSAVLPREATVALARMGVSVRGGDADIDLEPVASWPCLLPLEPAPLPDGSRTPILFEIAPARLSRVWAEIHRLAPQSAMELCPSDWWESDAVVLVRVTGVPAFTLLHTSDPSLTAFHEQAPAVWVEVGYRHPFAHLVQCAAGKLTLIRAPDRWTRRDGLFPSPELCSFPLAAAVHLLREHSEPESVELPLRLVECRTDGSPEFWVIHDWPLQQLHDLACELSPELLGRFRFAVVLVQGRTLVLVRAAPLNGTPPAAALIGLGCRPSRKAPNLIVPCGFDLSPPPRRSATNALAAEPASVTVLLPVGDGGFVPLVVPEELFAPLAECIDYQVTAPKHLASEPRRTPLVWESFEELPAPETKAEPAPAARTKRHRVRSERRRQPGWWSQIWGKVRPVRAAPPPAAAPAPLRVTDAVLQALPNRPPPVGALPRRKHDLNDRRARLENKFLQAAGLDGAETRLKLLPELAGIHTQLGNHAEATVCWLNAIWDHESPPPYWVWGWLQAEKKLGRVLAFDDQGSQLANAAPTPYTIRVLAAMTVWLSRDPGALSGVAGHVRLTLEAHEAWLPVRAVWLAQVALARATGGDALGLARARDRLNERLYHQGLSLERDVPGFLRFAGGEGGDRFQAVRDWLDRVRDPIHRWAEQLTRNRPADYVPILTPDYPDSDGRATKALIDLMLAWGMARLGEHTPARLLAAEASGFLRKGGDVVLGRLADAFEARVADAAAAKASAGSASDAVPDDENHLLVRFRIDTLRVCSRILEPAGRSNPYGTAEPNADDETLAVEFALDESAERGMANARAIIGRANDLFQSITDPLAATLLLEKLLTAALSLGDAEILAHLLPRVERILAPDAPRFAALVDRFFTPLRRGTDPRRPDDMYRLEALPALALRGLRRLGFVDTAERMQTRAVEWVLGGKELAQLRPGPNLGWLSALRAVLHVAQDWFGGPHEDRAIIVLDFARKSLFYTSDLPTSQRLALAQAYAAAVTHAQPRVAQGRVEELFRDLPGLYDVRQTNTHFALSPLALVDTVVRAAVSDDFTLGPTARRWLDEDEHRVRMRMQRDAAVNL